MINTNKSDTVTANSAFGYWGNGDTGGGIFRRPAIMFAAENDGDGDDTVVEPVVEPEKKPVVKIADADAKLLREVMALKAKVKAVESAKAVIEAQFDGLDPEQMRQMIADKTKAEEDKLRQSGDFDALKKRMAEEHQREVAKFIAERDGANNEKNKLEKLIKELTVGNSFASSRFLVEETVLTPSKARRVYEDHFEVEDGHVIAYDAPRDSTHRTPLVNGSGNPLSFDEAMKRIIESDPDHEHLMRTKAVPGPGVRSNTAVKPVIPQNNANMTGVDRIAAALANGIRKSS